MNLDGFLLLDDDAMDENRDDLAVSLRRTSAHSAPPTPSVACVAPHTGFDRSAPARGA